ncbi:MAG: heavy-metal-associated domain-containing protein [Opitutaceae bacterium]|jgi:copper chaperone|nr:heavy-metal-associated domain-containing protein [Opitutaceae bacterium]
MAHITLKVTGMKCGGCSGRVKHALTALEGY